MPRIRNICIEAQDENDSASCNVCQGVSGGKRITEIMAGCNNHTIGFRLCDVCIQEFGEKLWERLEELENAN